MWNWISSSLTPRKHHQQQQQQQAPSPSNTVKANAAVTDPPSPPRAKPAVENIIASPGPPVKARDALMACLKQHGWGPESATLSWIEDVERETVGDGQEGTEHSWFVVEGTAMAEALGTGGTGRMAPPDVVEDALVQVALVEGVEVDIRLDARGGTWENPTVYELLPSHTQKKLLPSHGHGIRILCWTSWDKNSRAAVERVIKMSRKNPHHVPVCLCFDPDPLRARDVLSDRKIVQANSPKWLWAGPKGWDSEAAEFLSLQDSGPTGFMFDGMGDLIESGDPDDLDFFDPLQYADDDHDDVHGDDNSPSSDAIDGGRLDHMFPNDPRIDSLTSTQARTVLTDFVSHLKLVTAAAGSGGKSNHGIPLTILMRTCVHFNTNDVTTQRQFFVAGDVFPDAEEAFEEFGKWVDERASGVGWMGVRHVTPAQKIVPALTCTLCGSVTIPKVDEIRYACFLCAPPTSTQTEDVTLCRACAEGHDARHPLAVLFPFNSKDVLLYGKNHVVVAHPAPKPASTVELHPGILCDACACPIEKTRYKNLCVPDHDLCHNCFKMFREFCTVSNHPKFDSFFHCKSSHMFVEMKCSVGIRFDREQQQPQQPPHVDGKRHVSLGVNNNVVPFGHTTFSWLPPTGLAIPHSHTVFSWRGGVE